MLFVKHSGGECHPVVRCYDCDRSMPDIGDAVVAYPRGVDEAQVVRVVIVHRGDCLQRAIAMLGNEHGDPHQIDFVEYLSRVQRRETVEC